MPHPMILRCLPFFALTLVGCGADGGTPSASADGGGILALADGAPGRDANGVSGEEGGPGPSADGGILLEGGKPGGPDGGADSGPSGGPLTCPSPGSYTKNGGGCGSERWDIKTGIDNGASGVSLVPEPTTIAQLVAIAAAGGGAVRSAPVEKTVWELRDVTLSMIKLETDSDYHIVLSDGPRTMIVEIPYPTCATGSAWTCFLSRARGTIDAKLNVGTTPQYPALTVSMWGVGFFDYNHSQTGVAPNAIELHPVLQICFGKGCSPG